MQQTRDEITQNLAERLWWEVARRDDSQVARRLCRKPVVEGVYRLDAGAVLDDCLQCATKQGDARSGKLRDLCRQVMSPWGAASGGCTPEVKELPLKGTGEARGKPPRSRAWLRECRVSPNTVGVNLRESHPLSRNTLPTGTDNFGYRGQRPDPRQVEAQRVTEAGESRHQSAGSKGLPDLPLCRSGFRRARLGWRGNHHLPPLGECSGMNVGGSQRE